MKKEFLFEEFLRHDRKQHKVISRTLRRQRVVVRIRTIFIRCALCLHFAFLKKTFWKQARSNFKEKIRKKGAKKTETGLKILYQPPHCLDYPAARVHLNRYQYSLGQ